jgi:beta-glucanase (GH16 family)
MWPQFNAGFTQSGNGEKGWYIQPSYAPTAAANPFRVSNGVLTISANPTPSNLLRYTNNLPYTTGWIDTYHEFSQTYGYFEMRAQLPAGQGTWPAFWLLPKNNSWPPEIDALEQINGNNTLVTTVHSTVSGANKLSSNHYSTGHGTSEPGMTTGFHTYGVDWEPNNITWYFDGREVFQTSTPADLKGKPMYMIASLGIGGYWPGNPTSSESWPQQMKIDYLRAYSAAPGAVSPPPPVISPPPHVIVSPSPASSSGSVSSPPPPPPTTLTADPSAGPISTLNESSRDLANWAKSDHFAALFNQFAAAGFHNEHTAAGQIGLGSSQTQSDLEHLQFLAGGSPHHHA